MRGLSLIQPWAQLVADGRKTWETRSWSTRYRGLVAIHASGRMTVDDCAAARYFGYEPRALPLGAIVAVARLEEVLESSDAERIIRRDMAEDAAHRELTAGDFTLGRYAWLLEDVRAIAPVSTRGSLGLWDVAPWLEMRLRIDAGLAGR